MIEKARRDVIENRLQVASTDLGVYAKHYREDVRELLSEISRLEFALLAANMDREAAVGALGAETLKVARLERERDELKARFGDVEGPR